MNQSREVLGELSINLWTSTSGQSIYRLRDLESRLPTLENGELYTIIVILTTVLSALQSASSCIFPFCDDRVPLAVSCGGVVR